MKYYIWLILLFLGFSSCKLSEHPDGFTNSNVQIVDMGKFNGLRIIEIASLNYLDPTSKTQTGWVFSEFDKENFSVSLIQSFRRWDVRVLPSAQTKIHINFTQLSMSEDPTNSIFIITADVAVSRNGIITRKVIKIYSKARYTMGKTKNNGVKKFIQELGELLRDQSFFKR